MQLTLEEIAKGWQQEHVNQVQPVKDDAKPLTTLDIANESWEQNVNLVISDDLVLE